MLSDLPEELLIEICGYIREPMSLLSMASTCRRFNQIVHYRNVENITVPLGEELFIETGNRIRPEARENILVKNPLREIFRGVNRFEKSAVVDILPEEELRFADILNMVSPPEDHELGKTFGLFVVMEDDEQEIEQKHFETCQKNSLAPYPVADLKNPRSLLFPRVYHLARSLNGQIVFYSPQLFVVSELQLCRNDGEPYTRFQTDDLHQNASWHCLSVTAPSYEVSAVLYASTFLNNRVSPENRNVLYANVFNLHISNLTLSGKSFPKFDWLSGLSYTQVDHMMLVQHVRTQKTQLDQGGLTMGICMDVRHPGTNASIEDDGEKKFTCKIDGIKFSGRLAMKMFNCGAHAGCMNKMNAANTTWVPCGPIETFALKPFLLLGGVAPECFASLEEVFHSLAGSVAERTLGQKEYFVFEMRYKLGEYQICAGTLITKLKVGSSSI